jgi:hypothetical protein
MVIDGEYAEVMSILKKEVREVLPPLLSYFRRKSVGPLGFALRCPGLLLLFRPRWLSQC